MVIGYWKFFRMKKNVFNSSEIEMKIIHCFGLRMNVRVLENK